MRKEASILISALSTGLLAFELSKYAFTKGARKEIGLRDEWTCQGVHGMPCVWEMMDGEPAKYKDGYWLTAAHYPSRHHKTGKGYHDPDTENGRMCCTIDHAVEEHNRGNDWGANLLLNQGVYHWEHVSSGNEMQWKPTLEDALEVWMEARGLYQTRRVNRHQEVLVGKKGGDVFQS